MRRGAVPRVDRLPALVFLLTSVAVVLALLGGVVPGVAHAVQAGRLPAVFGPEQYLGPPYAGSISGRSALLGALWWSGIVVVGVVLRLFRRARGTIALTIALALAGLINVLLPLAQQNVGWSLLGVLQTAAIATAVGLLTRRDLPVVRARAAAVES